VKAAGSIGAEFHNCVEQYLDTGTFTVGLAGNVRTRITGMMASFVDWATGIDGVVHSTELKVISKLHTYSGTLDSVGTLDGKPIIWDWKTSSRIYPEMALQLTAYAQAYKEQVGVDIKQGLIVHVSKDKPHFKLTVKEFKLGKRMLNKFLKLRAMLDDMKTPDLNGDIGDAESKSDI